MRKLLEHFIDKAPEGVIQAQIRFRRDGFTVAGAIKRSPVDGIFELLTVGEDHRSREGGKSGVAIFFDPEEVGYVGMQFETGIIQGPQLVR